MPTSEVPAGTTRKDAAIAELRKAQERAEAAKSQREAANSLFAGVRRALDILEPGRDHH